jgi:hypothetical protein
LAVPKGIAFFYFELEVWRVYGLSRKIKDPISIVNGEINIQALSTIQYGINPERISI